MKVSDFDFELPPERIAQHPTVRRDASRLMVLEPSSGAVEHRVFAELSELLRPDDLLVLNDTRVFPARLVGNKPSGGRVELLLIERLAAGEANETWTCLLRASRKPEPGSRLSLGAGLAAVVLEREGDEWRIRLEAGGGSSVSERIARIGLPPLPPYIRREAGEPSDADRERYQTVFAARSGAVAAPTAGLHFTDELLGRLAARRIARASLTLHVGPGTFLPVTARRVEDHAMHSEWFEIPPALALAVSATRRRGGRVVAVGTTVVRALEACATGDGEVESRSGRCALFIYPGFRFRVVDAMITNFHLPRSTLLMLVSAFAGRERVLQAYREAVGAGYRFYSYGDAMLVGRG